MVGLMGHIRQVNYGKFGGDCSDSFLNGFSCVSQFDAMSNWNWNAGSHNTSELL